MNNYTWLIAGGAAATGVLSMSWGYIRSFWQQLASYIIVTCKIQGSLEEAITMYFWKNFRTSPYGLRTYVGWTIFVRPSKRVQLVAMETIGTGGKLFWLKWRPIWLKRASTESKNDTSRGTFTRYNRSVSANGVLCFAVEVFMIPIWFRKLLPTWYLRLLVKHNFKGRGEGRKPDEWYWADIELFNRGIL